MEIKLKINCSHEKKNCFFSEQITIAVGYELANDLSLLGTLYIRYPEGTCRTQTARGSYDINLCYYVTSFNICRHHTYPCGWLGADVVS